jgi:Fic family protein
MKPPYEITPKIIELISSVSEKIGEINSANLQKPATELRKRNRIKTIHSSLVIEGNTLTEDQVTAIFENKRVAGPEKDISEVRNAIAVYEQINNFNAGSIDSFCKAHFLLMKGLVETPGRFRSKSVGIIKGRKLAHLAPPSEKVKPLMLDLFNYLKNDKDIPLIKSCVFHYETEFIHPFTDGNGRMGRLWQTVILTNKYKVFEFLPVEIIIKENQSAYYEALSQSDKEGKSNVFIAFMLQIMEKALDKLLNSQNIYITQKDRLMLAKDLFIAISFTRQEYLRFFKSISTATASRDLKFGIDEGLLNKTGDKRLAKYKFIQAKISKSK